MRRALAPGFAAIVFAFALFGATFVAELGGWNHGLGGWQWWALLAFLATNVVVLVSGTFFEVRRRRRRRSARG